VVCLQVADKHQLLALAEDATRAGVACSTYREPDVHDEPTAIALAADAKRLVRGLDLALAA
jgi:thiamine monophosphate synthase